MSFRTLRRDMRILADIHFDSHHQIRPIPAANSGERDAWSIAIDRRESIKRRMEWILFVYCNFFGNDVGERLYSCSLQRA